MRAGYEWTFHISNILPLALHLEGNGTTRTGESHSLLEVLGGLDMDAWIVGRRSKPLHVWANWCMGRQGIEPITGLPRPLIDLLARLSRLEDVSHKLRQFLAELSCGHDDFTLTGNLNLWRCFALTGLLQVQSRFMPSREGVDELVMELLDLLRRVSPPGFTTTTPGVSERNWSVLAWPAFTLGIHVENNNEGAMTLANDILSHIYDQSSFGGRPSDGSLLLLVNQFWNERQTVGRDSAFRNLQASAIEIGLW